MKFIIEAPEWFTSKGIDPKDFRHSLDNSLCIACTNLLVPLVSDLFTNSDYRILNLREAQVLVNTPEWTYIKPDEPIIDDTTIDEIIE